MRGDNEGEKRGIRSGTTEREEVERMSVSRSEGGSLSVQLQGVNSSGFQVRRR